MKIFALILCCLILSCSAQEINDNNKLALNIVKNHSKVHEFLNNKKTVNSSVKYQQMELGGICGFVGCNWRQLVSVVVTSKSSNSPSETLIFLVEGVNPDRGADPKVTLVELKKLTH